MHDDPIEELRLLMDEAARREATSVLLVPDEPAAFRAGGAVTRGDGPPYAAAEIARIAVAVAGPVRVAQIGADHGVLHVPARLDEARTAAVTIARSLGELTLVAWPVVAAHFDADALDLPPEFVAAADAPRGLVVVTGPSGCGKTTTCLALVERINRTRDAHVVTIAYSVECLLEPKRALLQHRQVGVDAPDMAEALASALSQEPDVLFVTEIRDAETLGVCLAAADAGRLVITQLHQPTAEAAVRRMIDLHAPDRRDAVRETLARVLRGVLAQRLLRRTGGGRVPAYGFLVPDDAARRAIAAGDLDALAALGPPVRRDLDEHARALVWSGRAAS